MKAVHGLMACFSSPEKFVAALRQAKKSGYTRCDTYMPFALKEGVDLSADVKSPVPKAMAIGGLLSGLGAYFMQVYAAHDYALNIGGRPLTSWPAFVPITFELTVLGSALTGMVTFFLVAGFPRLDHPVFNDPRFIRASSDRFFLCIRSEDPRFSPGETRRFLADLGAESIEEVPS